MNAKGAAFFLRFLQELHAVIPDGDPIAPSIAALRQIHVTGGRRRTGRAARVMGEQPKEGISIQIFGSRRIIAIQIRDVYVTIWIVENNCEPNEGLV